MGATKTAEALKQLLADSMVFYQNLRAYHWMVDGLEFFELHAKFEELYLKWAENVDEIAERLLAIGEVPTLRLSEMVAATRLQEATAKGKDARSMVQAVAADLDQLKSFILEAIGEGEGENDRITVNMLDDILNVIAKDRWMLNAWMGKTAS